MKLLQLLLVLGLTACIVAADEWTFEYPSNCLAKESGTPCDYKMKYELDRRHSLLNITVVAKQPNTTWTGVAFHNKSIVDGSVLLYGYLTDENKGVAFNGRIPDAHSAPVKDSVQFLVAHDVYYENETLFLFVSIPLLSNDINFEYDCFFILYPVGGGSITDNNGIVDKPYHPLKISEQPNCFDVTKVGVTEPTKSLLTMFTQKPLGIHEKLSTILPDMNTSAFYYEDGNTFVWAIPKDCYHKNGKRFQCGTFVWIGLANNIVTLNLVSHLSDGHYIGVGFANNRTPTEEIPFFFGYITPGGSNGVYNGWLKSINDAPLKSNENHLLSSAIWCEDGYMFMNATFNRDLINITCPYVVIPVGGGKVNDDEILEKPRNPMFVAQDEFCLTEVNITEPSGTNNKGKKVVVFFDISATELTGEAKCLPEDLNPTLFNILILNSANVSNDNMLIPANPEDAEVGGVYEKINNLKTKNSELMTLLTVSAWHRFLDMLNTTETRQTFINSTIELLKKHDMSGLNIVCHSSNLKNTELFIDLLKELDEAIKKQGTGLIVTLTLSANTITKKIIDLNEVHNYVEYIIVLTDMLNNRSAKVAEHQSPLFINPPYSVKSMESVMNMAAEDVPKDKLIGVVPAYAIGFSLSDPSNNEVGAPIVGQSPPGEYTNKKGLLAYYEMCALLNTTANATWLTVQHVPWANNGSSVFGYDNERSVKEKAHWMINNGFAGLALNKVEYDDFKGTFCGKGPLPLLNTLHKTLIGIGGVTGTVPPLSKILQSTESILSNTGKLVTHLPILHNTEKVVTNLHNTEKVVTHLPILHNTGKVETNTEKVVTHLHNTEKVVTHLPTGHTTEKVVTKHE